MAQLQLRDVRKSFGNFEVIKGVDMDIRPGEFMVLLVPPAAGNPHFCASSPVLRILPLEVSLSTIR